MQFMILIALTSAHPDCVADKGLDLYSKYTSQNRSSPMGSSDLTAYMASPVSQNILQQGPTFSSSEGVNPSNSGCLGLQQHPLSQGGLISTLMAQPQRKDCGFIGEDERYKQEQYMRRMIMTCKNIYGEDSDLCRVDCGNSSGVNDLNTTTKTGIPCLDAMTFTGLGPAQNTMESALYTSNRSSISPQETSNYSYVGPSPSSSLYSSMTPGPTGLCETIPLSFCKMMKGPILGQQPPKTCPYQGDIMRLKDYCTKDKCVDGCPTQTDCKKRITGPSISGPMMPPQLNGGMVYPPNLLYPPTVYPSNPMCPSMPMGLNPPPYIGMTPPPPIRTNPPPYIGTNPPINPLPFTSPQYYSSQNCPPLLNQTIEGRDYTNGKYSSKTPFDGIILIEPNTSLHRYVSSIITDPNRIRIVGDERKNNKKEVSSSNKKKDTKKPRKASVDTRDTLNVFQDVEDSDSTSEVKKKKSMSLKEKCTDIKEKEEACSKLLDSDEDE